MRHKIYKYSTGIFVTASEFLWLVKENNILFFIFNNSGYDLKKPKNMWKATLNIAAVIL